MKNKRPLLTIYMPVFNAGKYLPLSIESILNQSYSDFEFVIVDDASTDNSWKIIKSYAKKDKRIVAIKNPINLGVSLSSNIAISKAKGQFLARMDADDISLNDRIKKQIKFLQKNPKVVGVGGQCVVIDDQDKVIGYKNFPTNFNQLQKMIFWAIPMQQPSIMVNLAKLPKNFKWYQANKTSAEDVDLMFRFMLYGQITNLKDNVLFYRHLNSSLSHKNPKETFKLTFNSRFDALNLGFKPSFIAIFLNICQIIAISIIPSYLINELWFRFRGIKSAANNSEVRTFADTKV